MTENTEVTAATSHRHPRSTVDLRELGRIAGDLHRSTLREVRSIARLADRDLAQHVNYNIGRAADLELVTSEEAEDLRGIVDSFVKADIPELRDRVHQTFENAFAHPEKATPLGLTLASIARDSLEAGGEFGKLRTFFKDLAGAVGGGIGGATLGPAGAVAGAIAGGAAASL